MFTDKMLDRDAFARWFGQYASAPKYPDMDWRPEEPMEVQALRERLAGDVPLLRNPASRFSFIRRNENSVLLFVDGQCFECVQETAVLAEQLCAKGPDRKSTRLNSVTNAHLVCRLLLEKKNK